MMSFLSCIYGGEQISEQKHRVAPEEKRQQCRRDAMTCRERFRPFEDVADVGECEETDLEQEGKPLCQFQLAHDISCHRKQQCAYDERALFHGQCPYSQQTNRQCLHKDGQDAFLVHKYEQVRNGGQCDEQVRYVKSFFVHNDIKVVIIGDIFSIFAMLTVYGLF